MIQFDRVSKLYPGGTAAISDLSLEVPSSKITVFVGPSGCGKTTTLRMVNRLAEPSSGRVLIDGVDTATLKLTELRRGIGYVIQQAGLFPNKTILENVMTVPLLHRETRRTAAKRARALLDRVGLDEAYDARYPRQLSGGQQQRVGVARALAANPPILLMDEPFSAVDPVVRKQLQQELLRIQAELAKTVVFVTHDIDEAITLGDNVAVMRPGGHLAQYAQPEELLVRPANSFVADFVGRDRGYRRLGFVPAASLKPATELPARLGQTVGHARELAEDEWVVIVDTDNRPQGWLAPLEHPATDRVSTEMLNLGGTLATVGGSLREALDAALSSPSGRGVLVDEGGRYVGTLKPSDVLGQLGPGAGRHVAELR
jgi:osmoprotectant transport system ATP-binding protein